MLSYNGSIPGRHCTSMRDPRSASTSATTGMWTRRFTGMDYGWSTVSTAIPARDAGTGTRSATAFTYMLPVPRRRSLLVRPHIREDYGLEIGLYGTSSSTLPILILVVGRSPGDGHPRRPIRRRRAVGAVTPSTARPSPHDGPLRQRDVHGRGDGSSSSPRRVGDVVRRCCWSNHRRTRASSTSRSPALA